MRKRKVYFGQNKVKHRLGRVRGQWVVPRLLREYFTLRMKCGGMEQMAKMNLNHSFGRLGMQHYPHSDVFKTTPGDYTITARKRADNFPDVPDLQGIFLDQYTFSDEMVSTAADSDGGIDLSAPINEGYLVDLPKLQQAAIDSPDASKAFPVADFYRQKLELRMRYKRGYLGQLSIPVMRELVETSQQA